MEQINIQFLEEYKRLDKLCRDAYRSDKGVSTYIDIMKSIGYSRQTQWNATLRKLIKLRHIRNKLTHDVGTMDYAMCNQDDIIWLSEFHGRILSQTDPLSLHRMQTKPVHSAPHSTSNASYRTSSRNSGCLSMLAGILVFIFLIMLLLLCI